MSQDVKIFTTPTCPWCHKVKSYLDENKIKYENFDVSHDQKAAQEMIEKTQQMAVPQIWIDDEVIIGFDKNRLDQLLKK